MSGPKVDYAKLREQELASLAEARGRRLKAVSYTHLDVYKRQAMDGWARRYAPWTAHKSRFRQA